MPKIVSKYSEAQKGMREASRELLARAAQSHASIARQLAPVDTGYLRNHIAVSESTRGFEVVSAAEYSTYVELGTVNSPAQPFFYPAFGSAVRQMREEARQVTEQHLRDALK
jgi:HK97 gp10 family phage protein